MKRTLFVAFVGLVLTGGFMTSLYLVSRPTNPPSSAHGPTENEIVIPVAPPKTEGATEVGRLRPAAASPSATVNLQELCQRSFNKRTGDADFNPACDLDKNGIVNGMDLGNL